MSWEIRPVGRFVLDSQVVSSGAPYSVTDEAFVVLDMFGMLGGGEVDSVYIHSHGIFGGFFWSRVGRGVALSTPQFLHS